VATQDFSNFSPLLKDVYGDELIVDLLTNETYLLDRIERKNATDIGAWNGQGEQFVFAAHVGRNRSRGFALTDGGQLATAGRQRYVNCSVSIRGFSAAIEFTELVKRASAAGRSAAAFASATKEEMDGGMRDLRQRINRMAYGDGTGLLTACTATENATVISIADVSNIHVDDYVDVLTVADGTVRATGVLVTAVDSSAAIADSSTQTAGRVTLDTRVSVTNAEGFYLTGSRVLETEGLTSVTGTRRRLHGVDSTTQALWDGNVTQAGWVFPSEDLAMQMAQRIKIRTGQDITQFVTTYGIQRRLASTFQNQRRWTNAEGLTLEGGYQSLMISAGGKQVPVTADRDCPTGKRFALNMKPYAWAELGTPGWLENGGGLFHLKDGSTAGTKLATWQAFIVWYAALICQNPATQGRIEQIKDDVPIPHD